MKVAFSSGLQMNYAFGWRIIMEREESLKGKRIGLTFVKVGDGRLSLHLKLLLSILLVRIISLDVVPGIVLEDIISRLQIPLPKHERIRSFCVVRRVV